jgi:formylglycine-generating enzyme required for sulfatase activity
MTTVFISYSHLYSAQVERVKQGLRAQGVRVWIDHESLAPGTPSWEQAIRQGIQAADVVLYLAAPEALLSHNVQGELDVARRHSKPILPIWLAGDGLEWVDVVPMVMSKMQYIDARGPLLDAAIARIVQSLARFPSPASPHSASSSADEPAGQSIPILARLDGLGFAGRRDRKTGVAYIIPPVRPVPAGKFTMGSAQDDPAAYDDEKPQYSIPVGAFEIGQYPVTVAEYALAVQAGAVPAPQEPGNKQFTWAAQQQRAEHPVVCVSWENVRDYCRWLAKVTGQPWRLPTEAEWEKAARWDTSVNPPHARIYPWGDTWDKARANTNDGGPGMTTEIGKYASKGDASPYGCHDMAGNVWEWTSTAWYDNPPYDATKYENDSDNVRVLRGGSWSNDPQSARAACRYGDGRYGWGEIRGFRVARGRGLVM